MTTGSLLYALRIYRGIDWKGAPTITGISQERLNRIEIYNDGFQDDECKLLARAYDVSARQLSALFLFVKLDFQHTESIWDESKQGFSKDVHKYVTTLCLTRYDESKQVG